MRKDIFHNHPISLSTDCYFLEVLDISETKYRNHCFALFVF